MKSIKRRQVITFLLQDDEREGGFNARLVPKMLDVWKNVMPYCVRACFL